MDRMLPIIVQFGFGAILCLVGLWCGFQSGYITLGHREDRRLLLTIGAGFVILLSFAVIFTFYAPHWPTTAEAVP